MAGTGGYSREEINRMQSDAVRRVREMQARAQRSIGNTGSMDFGTEKRPQGGRDSRDSRDKDFRDSRDPRDGRPGGHPPSRGPDHHPPAKKGKGFDLLNMLNLKSLNLNSDTILIIMILLMVSGESTDELLLLALVYILI